MSMKEPVLAVLAAGMGSRFGGLKQITPVDDLGHSIIDFSLYDAYNAGFRKVAFIIKHAIEDDFKARVGRRMEKYFDVRYVYQELDSLPLGYAVPEGRVKPWGTGHAVACCKGVIDAPFAVINADDYYGRTAYRALYDFLTSERRPDEHAMVAYELRNTVTENGYVSRGICTVENGLLKDVVERTHIEKDGEDAVFEENGSRFPLPGGLPVSMNCWAFGESMLDELVSRFPAWLDEALTNNPLKGEYFLPSVANSVISEGLGSVRVLSCTEQWHGVTYREDMPLLVDSIKKMHEAGLYPDTLLE